jgi:hypothetical protein
MLDELRTWWQNLTPDIQALIQNGSLVVVALLGGHFLGTMVARALRAKNFDAAMRVPGSAPPGPDTEHGITPTLIAGLLVRLTVWGAAGLWLARQYGQTELAANLGLVLKRSWALAGVLVATLGLGGVLSRRLIDCLQGPQSAAPEGSPFRNGITPARRGVAGAVGAAVYGLVTILVLLISADLFDWPLTRTSTLALWQIAQHLLIAGAALLIGCLGARLARDLVPPEGASQEKRAGHYTALGIVAATTVLAVAVLLSSAGLLFGLAALAVLGFLLWLVRGYLPDVLAGLQLRAQHVREIWFDGVAWQVVEVGFLTTQVSRAGEFCRMQNRRALEARMHGAPAESAPR